MATYNMNIGCHMGSKAKRQKITMKIPAEKGKFLATKKSCWPSFENRA
jgi:hypothetical protein